MLTGGRQSLVVVVVLRRWWCVVAAGGLTTCTEPNCPVWLVRDRVAQPRQNKLIPSWVMTRAIHFGELHFQQHFLRPHRTEGQHVDHVLRVGLGDHSGALGNIFGGNVAGKHDGGARRRDRDLFVRENSLFFFGRGA